MKLAVAIERFNPAASGRERATLQFVQALIQRGHHLTVVCGDAPHKLTLEGGEIRRLDVLDFKHQPKVKPFADWARQLFETSEFDASLSVTTVTPATVVQPRRGTFAALERNRAAVPRLSKPGIAARVLNRSDAKRELQLKLERKAISHPMVKRLAVLSRQAAADLGTDFGVEDDRVTVVPNGVSLPVLSSDERDAARQRMREGFGISSDAVVFMFAAFNPDQSGLTPLLHAMKATLKSGVDSANNAVLLTAGVFPFHHQQLAASLGIRDAVKVVGETEHIADVYAAADVVVHPTFYDAGSRVVLEALATQTPVIASARDGSSEQVVSDKHSPRGIVVSDLSDGTALANAMITMSDVDTREAFTSTMQGLADQLSFSRHVDALESLLQESSAS